MISNEHGLNFIEIPFSGGDLFVDSLRESNRDLKEDGVLLDTAIEYYNVSIIQNPSFWCFFTSNEPNCNNFSLQIATKLNFSSN